MLANPFQRSILRPMEEPAWEIRPELVEWVENMKNSDEENIVVLRGLYRFYFDTKPIANLIERGYLLGEGTEFGSKTRIPGELDNQILKEESERFYGQGPQSDKL